MHALTEEGAPVCDTPLVLFPIPGALWPPRNLHARCCTTCLALTGPR